MGDIHALFFDLEGHGPDHIAIALKDVPAIAEVGMGPRLGLMVAHTPSSPTFFVLPGGFLLELAGIEELYRQLGAWLEANRG